MSRYRLAGLAFVFLWFFGGGIGHFATRESTGFFLGIVPDYIPWPLAAVYVSGVFEILGALGLLLPATRPWAGLGLFALTLCVSPANIWMLQHPERYPAFPRAAPWLRMVIQVFLLWVVWTSTREPRVGVAAPA
jgi:uncharacterized membrane protein